MNALKCCKRVPTISGNYELGYKVMCPACNHTMTGNALDSTVEAWNVTVQVKNPNAQPVFTPTKSSAAERITEAFYEGDIEPKTLLQSIINNLTEDQLEKIAADLLGG